MLLTSPSSIQLEGQRVASTQQPQPSEQGKWILLSPVPGHWSLDWTQNPPASWQVIAMAGDRAACGHWAVASVMAWAPRVGGLPFEAKGSI